MLKYPYTKYIYFEFNKDKKLIFLLEFENISLKEITIKSRGASYKQLTPFKILIISKNIYIK